MASTADKLQQSLTSGIQNAIPGVDAEKLSSMLNSNSIASTLGNLEKEAQNALKSIQGQATALLGSSLDSIAGTFPDAAKQLFTQLNPDTTKLASIVQDITKGPKEVDAKLESLASDSASAIANPVAFISKPVNDAIKGVDTMTQGSGIKDLMSGMDSLDISNLSKSVGFNITSSSDITKAISSVTNGLASQVKSIPDTLGSLKSSVLAPITSTVKSFEGSLMSGIKSTLGSIDSSTGLSSIISAGKNLANSAIGVLPTSLQSYVSSKSNSFISSTAEKLLGDSLGSFNNILGAIPGVSSADSLLTKLLSLGDSSGYSSLTDKSGKPLTSSLGNNSSATLDVLYAAAKTICAGVEQPSTLNYRYNKDLYDVLLQLASELGISDLIKQLEKCAGGEAAYFDSRSLKLLQSATRTAAQSGDVNTYSTLQQTIGAQNVIGAKQDAIILNTNMSGTSENVETYNQVIERFGYTAFSLLTKQTLGKNVISGSLTALMSASNTKVVDDALGSDVRKLVQGAVYAYAV